MCCDVCPSLQCVVVCGTGNSGAVRTECTDKSCLVIIIISVSMFLSMRTSQQIMVGNQNTAGSTRMSLPCWLLLACVHFSLMNITVNINVDDDIIDGVVKCRQFYVR